MTNENENEMYQYVLTINMQIRNIYKCIETLLVIFSRSVSDMMLSTTLNTIYVTNVYRGGPFYWRRKPDYRENHGPAASHRQTLSHNVLSSKDSNSQL